MLYFTSEIFRGNIRVMFVLYVLAQVTLALPYLVPYIWVLVKIVV